MKIQHIAFLVVMSWFLTTSIACGGPAKNTKQKTTTVKKQIPEPNVGNANEIVKKYALRKNEKRANLWKVFVKKNDSQGKEKANLVLVRIEIDLNFDGKIDIKRFYKKNVKTHEMFDLDYDGKIDLITYYSQGYPFKKAYFLHSKTKPDVFKYFEVEGKKGKKHIRLVRKERDTDLDGKIDYWEYWENGSLDRIGRDTDFNGKVDVWEKSSNNN